MTLSVERVLNVHPDPRKFISHPDLPSGTLFGVEVELEGTNRNTVKPSPYWDIHEDSSLRNAGSEIVMRMPLSGADFFLAMHDLSDIVNSLDSSGTLSISHRTSVHVHIDFRDKSIMDVVSFMCGFSLFESALYTVCGKDRYSNIYCPGLSSAVSQVFAASKLHSAAIKGDHRAVQSIIHNWCKYSSFNLKCLESYGSVEIRSHKGTRDPQEIILWVRLLDKLLAYCVGKTPADILLDASSKDSSVLCTEVFDELAPYVINDNYTIYKRNNLRNLYYISDVDNITAQAGKYKQNSASVVDDLIQSLLSEIVSASRDGQTEEVEARMEESGVFTARTNSPTPRPTSLARSRLRESTHTLDGAR